VKSTVIGSQGRLGAALVDRLSLEGDVTPVNRRHTDLEDPTAATKLAETLEGAVVFYAAGLTGLEACESNPRKAVVLNAEVPAMLAAACDKRGIRFVTFSTDYVFDGLATSPYLETDPAGAESVYARTKLAGEKLVRAAGRSHWILRVSWLFGPHGDHFVRQILRRALAGEPLSAVTDKLSIPTSTLEIADSVVAGLTRDVPGGLYHCCGQGACSWHDLACETVRLAAAEGLIDTIPGVRPIRLADLPALSAPRPVYSAMNSTRWQEATGFALRPWAESLHDFIRLEKQHL